MSHGGSLMYGKLFESMYAGTLYGNWEAIVTLQQFVIVADESGLVDMTPPAIAAKTSIPLEIIEKGIKVLSEEDKYSRSEKEGGKRIILVDESRPWGWQIVNYKYYRDLASREDKKKADKERIRRKRAKKLGFEDDIIDKDCAYCGESASGVDHIIPTTKGGKDEANNVVPCCQRCNSSKGNRDLLTFLNDENSVNRQIDKNLVKQNQTLMRLVAYCSKTSLFVADVAYTDTDTDTDTYNNIDLKTLNDFIKFRKDIKSPLTDRALTIVKNKLNDLSHNEQREVVDRSIENNWKGLFPKEKIESFDPASKAI